MLFFECRKCYKYQFNIVSHDKANSSFSKGHDLLFKSLYHVRHWMKIQKIEK